MATDREVIREVWQGRIPTCFQLFHDEVYGIQEPDPFHLMLPKLSYFPLVTDKVRRHFLRFIQPEKHDAEMWLDFSGQPIKWHYPVGVLYDIFMGSERTLPWNITVHFDKFPEADLLHCPTRDVVESYFMSCIKEADILKHKTHIACSMQKKEHNQLWLGLVNDKFEQFWSINRRLMENSEPEGFKYIPFRCYRGDQLAPPVQILVKPVNERGQPNTLGFLISQLFPDSDNVKVVTHGVHPPMETPLQWLSEHLSYPDNFLHLCVHSR